MESESAEDTGGWTLDAELEAGIRRGTRSMCRDRHSFKYIVECTARAIKNPRPSSLIAIRNAFMCSLDSSALAARCITTVQHRVPLDVGRTTVSWISITNHCFRILTGKIERG